MFRRVVLVQRCLGGGQGLLAFTTEGVVGMLGAKGPGMFRVASSGMIYGSGGSLDGAVLLFRIGPNG